MFFFKKKDPLPLYLSGKISDERFILKLSRLKPEDVSEFDLIKWRDFILDRCSIATGYFQHLKYLKIMVDLIKNDDLLIDIALKGSGDDIINTDAVRNISSQNALQKVLESYNMYSPFHIYTTYNDRFVYNMPAWSPSYRGGRLMYVLLDRIDREHFNAALKNSCGKMAWLDMIKSGEVEYWSFYEGDQYNIKFPKVYDLAKQKGFLE